MDDYSIYDLKEYHDTLYLNEIEWNGIKKDNQTISIEGDYHLLNSMSIIDCFDKEIDEIRHIKEVI